MVNLTGKIKKIDRHRRTVVIEAKMFGRSVEFKLGLEITAVSSQLIGESQGREETGRLRASLPDQQQAQVGLSV